MRSVENNGIRINSVTNGVFFSNGQSNQLLFPSLQRHYRYRLLNVSHYKLKLIIEAVVIRLSAISAAELFFSPPVEEEGRDNRISDDDWLSNVEWEFLSQSVAMFGVHTSHTRTQQPHTLN